MFVDAAGCNHCYKELELNALNTVWNLMLNRPYGDGGGERSGRIAKEGEPDYWEVGSQRTATRVLRGALHDDTRPSQWCCEIALAHADTLSHVPVQVSKPAVGDYWRINFSRVENKGQINWVWSPQIIWSPQEKRYVGQVNMHLPDAWGLVVFVDESGHLDNGAAVCDWTDSTWRARHAAMNVYYAAKAFQEINKLPPTSIEELRTAQLIDEDALAGFGEISIKVDSTTKFVAEISGSEWVASITGDRFLTVRPKNRAVQQNELQK